MWYAGFERRKAVTSLGEVDFEVPGDWKGTQQEPGNPFGEWCFNHPDAAASLYLRTEAETVPGTRDLHDRISFAAICQANADRMTYADVQVGEDPAHLGCMYRSHFRDEDQRGPIRHERRVRYVATDQQRVLTFESLLIYDEVHHEKPETIELTRHLAVQFDLAIGQWMRPFGMDVEADPGLLWREGRLPMGCGDWNVRRPLGWRLDHSQGNQPGCYLWSARAPGNRWQIDLECAQMGGVHADVEAVAEDLLQRMRETLPLKLPLTAPIAIGREPGAFIVTMELADDQDPLDGLWRWYVLKMDGPRLVLYRVTFAYAAGDAASGPCQAMLAFSRGMVNDVVVGTSRLVLEKPA